MCFKCQLCIYIQKTKRNNNLFHFYIGHVKLNSKPWFEMCRCTNKNINILNAANVIHCHDCLKYFIHMERN